MKSTSKQAIKAHDDAAKGIEGQDSPEFRGKFIAQLLNDPNFWVVSFPTPKDDSFPGETAPPLGNEIEQAISCHTSKSTMRFDLSVDNLSNIKESIKFLKSNFPNFLIDLNESEIKEVAKVFSVSFDKNSAIRASIMTLR